MATKVDFTLPDGNTYSWTAEGYLEELIRGLIEENKYTLPAATDSQLGGVKTGSNITNNDGTISLTKKNVTDALGYTPPTTDTIYTHPTTTARTGKPTSNVTVQLGSAFTVSQVSNDANGHVSAITDRTVTVNHPTTSGNKHIPSGGSSGQVLKWKADGEAQWAADSASTLTSGVSGVKGSAESTYRTGQVNITAANVGAATSSHTHSEYAATNHTHSGYAASSHNHAAGDINSGTLAVARGGTGQSSLANVTGVGSANKLATARTIQTNLASTSTASFDGSANVSPGVTGILPIANGGTGRSDGRTQAISFTFIRNVDLNSVSSPGWYIVYEPVNGPNSNARGTLLVTACAKQYASNAVSVDSANFFQLFFANSDTTSNRGLFYRYIINSAAIGEWTQIA